MNNAINNNIIPISSILFNNININANPIEMRINLFFSILKICSTCFTNFKRSLRYFKGCLRDT